MKKRTILGGAGFYAVLFLCLAAVGTGAWLLLFRGNDAGSPDTSAGQETLADQSDADAVEAVAPKAPAQPAAKAVEMPKIPVETVETVDDTPVEAEAPSLIVSPLSGTVVAAFSVNDLQYSETLEDWRTHDGVDIAAAQGTQVLAACAGTVLSVADDDLMGTTVVLKHADGYQTTYANLQSKPDVREGDAVSAGQVIGAVGSTSLAESAEGPHLHFSVTRDGDAVDPNEYLGK